MKLITAIIQPDKLDDVREALFEAEIKRITVSRCTGHGRQGDEELYRGQKVAPNLIPKIRLDIAVNDDYVDTACQAILKAAKHGTDGKIGDGKILISPLHDIIRIRTGEKGTEAI